MLHLRCSRCCVCDSFAGFGMTMTRSSSEKDRWWEVRDPGGELVCVTVYKRGAVEVVRRLVA